MTKSKTRTEPATETVAGARRIEYMPLDQIPPATRNPKSHDLAALVLSIAQFGYTDPSMLDERTGRLVGGHGRLEAVRAIRAYHEGGHLGARKAGYNLPATTWETYRGIAADAAPPEGVTATDGGWLVPVVRGWSSADDAEAEALLVALNRMTELGGWDKGLLADILGDLERVELLDVAGYDSDDLETLLRKTGKLELDMPEAMPDPQPVAPPVAEQQPAGAAPIASPVRNPVATDDEGGDEGGDVPGVEFDDGVVAAQAQAGGGLTPSGPPPPVELRPEIADVFRQQFGVMVVCATSEEQDRVLAQLTHEGYRVTAITT